MKYYIVNAFAAEPFRGNPAGVCVLDEWLPTDLMQKIARENGLPETAFFLRDGRVDCLRWFTPLNEIDLCGHATLAAAYVVMEMIEPGASRVQFETVSGTLTVEKREHLYRMVLPKRRPEKIRITDEVAKAMNIPIRELYSGRDLIAVLNDEDAVLHYRPDYQKLSRLNGWLGIVITAKGNSADFVSRYFCPELREEDPVTGSSHCSLVPIWSEKLNKTELVAEQLSERGGVLYCEQTQDKVMVAGEACLYLKGELII